MFGFVELAHLMFDLYAAKHGLGIDDLLTVDLDFEGLLDLLKGFSVSPLLHEANGLVPVHDAFHRLGFLFLGVVIRDQIVENE